MTQEGKVLKTIYKLKESEDRRKQKKEAKIIIQLGMRDKKKSKLYDDIIHDDSLTLKKEVTTGNGIRHVGEGYDTKSISYKYERTDSSYYFCNIKVLKISYFKNDFDEPLRFFSNFYYAYPILDITEEEFIEKLDEEYAAYEQNNDGKTSEEIREEKAKKLAKFRELKRKIGLMDDLRNSNVEWLDEEIDNLAEEEKKMIVELASSPENVDILKKIAKDPNVDKEVRRVAAKVAKTIVANQKKEQKSTRK